MFFYKVEGHMPKLSSFGRGKKFRPKKSLTSLLHAALQLHNCTMFSIHRKRVSVWDIERLKMPGVKYCTYQYVIAYIAKHNEVTSNTGLMVWLKKIDDGEIV